jgi:hypothetical protein
MQIEHFLLTSTTALCLHLLSIIIYYLLPLLYTYVNKARFTYFTTALHLHVLRIIIYLLLPSLYTPINKARYTYLYPYTTSAPVKDRCKFYTSFTISYYENLFYYFYPYYYLHSLFNYLYLLKLTLYFSFLL